MCYLFIFGGEAGSILLIERHHDSHHIFAVHNGDGENILGLVLSQVINKVTEVRALGGEMRGSNQILNWISLSGICRSSKQPGSALMILFSPWCLKQMVLIYLQSQHSPWCDFPLMINYSQDGTKIIIGTWFRFDNRFFATPETIEKSSYMNELKCWTYNYHTRCYLTKHWLHKHTFFTC